MPEPAIILITGIQAAGKSTVAQLLAERLPRSVHVRGDLFRRMIVSGRADTTRRTQVGGPDRDDARPASSSGPAAGRAVRWSSRSGS